jgi:hypothetical protein
MSTAEFLGICAIVFIAKAMPDEWAFPIAGFFVVAKVTLDVFGVTA